MKLNKFAILLFREASMEKSHTNIMKSKHEKVSFI
jgi:hypothetical protein